MSRPRRKRLLKQMASRIIVLTQRASRETTKRGKLDTLAELNDAKYIQRLIAADQKLDRLDRKCVLERQRELERRK